MNDRWQPVTQVETHQPLEKYLAGRVGFICLSGIVLMNKSLTDDRLEARQVQRVSAGIEERAPT